jgi:hypothetical protein
MKSTLQAVVYISLLLQTFLSKQSLFLFIQNTKTILFIWNWFCIKYGLLVHMFCKIWKTGNSWAISRYDNKILTFFKLKWLVWWKSPMNNCIKKY